MLTRIKYYVKKKRGFEAFWFLQVFGGVKSNDYGHSEPTGEESILFKTNFDYCFTPSSRSFRFAIRKTFIHFFGATSDWVRVAHTASYAKSVLDFLLENSRSFRFKFN